MRRLIEIEQGWRGYDRDAAAIVKSGAPLGGALFEAGSNAWGRRGRLQLGEDRPQPLHAWRKRDRIGGNHLIQQCDQDGFVGVVKVRHGGKHRQSLRRLLVPRNGASCRGVSRNVHDGHLLVGQPRGRGDACSGPPPPKPTFPRPFSTRRQAGGADAAEQMLKRTGAAIEHGCGLIKRRAGPFLPVYTGQQFWASGMQRRDFITFLAGGLSGWSSVAGAQAAIRVIGYLSSGTAARPVDAGFHQGLSEIGYVEGQNLAIEYRWAEGQYDRLPGLVADLVGRKVEVIATVGMPSALAAKKATSTIPIVFNVGTDPVADGLVGSLARPGANLTGVTVISTELMPKRLELLSELLPRAGVFALLVHPNNASAEPQSRDLQEAARAKGVQLHILKAGTESEIDAAFATLVELHVDALVVGTDVFFVSQSEQLVSLAARYAIPAIYEGANS